MILIFRLVLDEFSGAGMVIKRSSRLLKMMLSVVLMFMLVICNQSIAETVSNNRDDAILQELKQIRVLLERIEKKGLAAPAPRKPQITTAQLSTKGRPAMGKDDAPVTIVEISDYQCPYCKRFVDNTFPQLKKEYIDTGKVRLVFKDLALPFHKNARKAAQAAHCAGDQGKYWEMHDVLFKNAKQLDEKYLPEYALSISLDQDEFATCLNSNQHLDDINRSAAEVNQTGLTGTPSFVIGKTTGDVIKGDVVRGAQPFASLKIFIDKQLKLIN